MRYTRGVLRGRDDLESDHSPVLSGSREHPQCGSYLAHANDLEPAALHRQPVEHRGIPRWGPLQEHRGAAVLSRRARRGAAALVDGMHEGLGERAEWGRGKHGGRT